MIQIIEDIITTLKQVRPDDLLITTLIVTVMVMLMIYALS